MIKSASIQINDQTLNVETGRVARQATGSVVVTFGDTAVLVTVVGTDDVRAGIDFLPLTVEYKEMSYAGGKFPGNFFRRDMGRPGEGETLVSRLIDRPLRPLFPDNYYFETQIMASVLSTDKENDADVLAILGASAALEVSDIPFQGPIAAVRVGRVNGSFVANPTMTQREESDIDLIVAGNRSAVVMVEGGSEFVSEEDVTEAILFGQESLQPMLKLQDELREAVGKPKRELPPITVDEELLARVKEQAEDRLREVITTADKQLRQQREREASKAVVEALRETYPDRSGEIKNMVHDLEKEMIRSMVLEEERRIDGRPFDRVRDIECIVGVLPRVHGSALFTRGETQALVLTTLGTEMDSQKIETILGDSFRRFLFHYNFPPYSVGEAKRIGGPGRREIGHGALARRALLPVIPDEEQFQYTLRVVSEILESNGSSSMASVCGGSLSMMDAGVPIKEAVAGVAMGLMAEGDKVAVLTDIIGDEDHFGDMDFKVTGTKDGITALQMDIKIEGINREIFQRALAQAREARLHILDKMNQAIGRSREEISPYAPSITTIQIHPEKIRTVIGPGGKTIREITAMSECKVNVDDSGKVVIAAADAESAQVAIEMIKKLIQEAEVGNLYRGKVRKIMDFGAFVEILPGTDGLVHISQLDKERVNKVTDILQEGDEVMVKVIDIDKNGRIALSRKAALGEKPEDAS